MRFSLMETRVCGAWIVVLGVTVVSAFQAPPAQTRTWYVTVGGTGDAPTIQAGIDSAVAGDVVLVAGGTYQIDTPVHMKGGITVISESGAYQTRIVPVPSTNPPCAFSCLSISGGGVTEINGFWMEGFVWSPDIWGGTACGVWLAGCGSMEVLNNVMTGNGSGVRASLTGNVNFRNNTLVGNGGGLDIKDAIALDCRYNIIWDNNDGCIFGFFNNFLDISDGCIPAVHFSEDPQFCGPSGGNYYLQSDSPCAPGNSPWPEVELIGALPVACGPVKAESKTWGAIKELYQ